MSEETRAYDELPQHDKDMIRIGFEVGFDAGCADMNKRFNLLGHLATREQEIKFIEAIRQRRAQGESAKEEG